MQVRSTSNDYFLLSGILKRRRAERRLFCRLQKQKRVLSWINAWHLLYRLLVGLIYIFNQFFFPFFADSFPLTFAESWVSEWSYVIAAVEAACGGDASLLARSRNPADSKCHLASRLPPRLLLPVIKFVLTCGLFMSLLMCVREIDLLYVIHSWLQICNNPRFLRKSGIVLVILPVCVFSSVLMNQFRSSDLNNKQPLSLNPR